MTPDNINTQSSIPCPEVPRATGRGPAHIFSRYSHVCCPGAYPCPVRNLYIFSSPIISRTVHELEHTGIEPACSLFGVQDDTLVDNERLRKRFAELLFKGNTEDPLYRRALEILKLEEDVNHSHDVTGGEEQARTATMLFPSASYLPLEPFTHLAVGAGEGLEGPGGQAPLNSLEVREHESAR